MSVNEKSTFRKGKYQLTNANLLPKKVYIPENLPDTFHHPGVNFVLRTTFYKPKIHYEQLKQGKVIYSKVDNSDKCLLERLTAPKRYHVIGRWYSAESGVKVYATRETLAKAWVDGFNYMNYYNEFCKHLKNSHDLVNDKEVKKITKMLETLANEWTCCFHELDCALGILHQCEEQHDFPKDWKQLAPFDIKDLSKCYLRLHCESTRGDLTSIFIASALHMEELTKSDTIQDIMNYAKEVKFVEPVKCRIPGLSDYYTRNEVSPSNDLLDI